MKQNKWKHLKFEKYVFVLLLAIELIMSFTFLGFIHIDPISLTTAYIPIVVAGCLLGPLESTLDRIGIWTSKYVLRRQHFMLYQMIRYFRRYIVVIQ
mgnify:CR=1 FL=1